MAGGGLPRRERRVTSEFTSDARLRSDQPNHRVTAIGLPLAHVEEYREGMTLDEPHWPVVVRGWLQASRPAAPKGPSALFALRVDGHGEVEAIERGGAPWSTPL